jgi:hypothetical protein
VEVYTVVGTATGLHRRVMPIPILTGRPASAHGSLTMVTYEPQLGGLRLLHR